MYLWRLSRTRFAKAATAGWPDEAIETDLTLSRLGQAEDHAAQACYSSSACSYLD